MLQDLKSLEKLTNTVKDNMFLLNLLALHTHCILRSFSHNTDRIARIRIRQVMKSEYAFIKSMNSCTIRIIAYVNRLGCQPFCGYYLITTL